MANIKIKLDHPIFNGLPLSFKAPCDCTAVTGIKVEYIDGESAGTAVFTFTDAHGTVLTNIGNLFAKDAMVRVILDTTANKAYIQNADTNAYIENTFLKKSGGTMTGAINMGSKKITSLATPTADTDAATKKYVDDGLGKKQDAFTTLPIEQGGTGATTANEATYKIIGGMPETTASVNDESLFVFRRTTPSPENGTVFYKKAPLLVDYLSQKLVPRFVQKWSNKSSGSDFLEQTLDIDISGFDFIMVRYKVYKTNAYGTYKCEYIKTSAAGILETVSQGGKYRGVSFPDGGGVKFGNVYNADDTVGTNDFLIPFEIYGCKLYDKK